MKYLGTPASFEKHINHLHVLTELYTIGEIKEWLRRGEIQVCLTERDRFLVDKIKRRFGIEVPITDQIPTFELTYLDKLLIINYWRSPIKRDLSASMWVTYDECLYETSFSFVVWQLSLVQADDHPTYTYLAL